MPIHPQNTRPKIRDSNALLKTEQTKDRSQLQAQAPSSQSQPAMTEKSEGNVRDETMKGLCYRY